MLRSDCDDPVETVERDVEVLEDNELPGCELPDEAELREVELEVDTLDSDFDEIEDLDEEVDKDDCDDRDLEDNEDTD